MKKLLTLLFVLSLSFTSVTFAQETIQKTYCMSSIGYKSTIDDLKKELLNNAKRDAVNELFGELIKSFTKVENFKLTEDKIRASSAGFVRIKGNPAYYQGKNLGELCVRIEAYAKDEDFEKFKPKILTKKSCVAEGDVKTIKGRTQEKAKLEALIDYDQTLQKYPPKHILPLLHEIKFLESGFISSTSVYCVKVRGLVYPIEIAALTEPSELVIAKKGQNRRLDKASITESLKNSPITLPQTGTPFKDFKDLRIEVESLQVTKQNDVVVFFRYINKTQKELKIMVSQGEKTGSGSYSIVRYPTYLTDDKGNEYRLMELNGIGSIRHYGDSAHGNALTVLPGIPATASIKFNGRRDWQIGSLFSLISPQLILATDQNGNLKVKRDNKNLIESTVNVSIRNIKFRK